MTTLLGIAGSLRRNSYNALLLRAAAELAPEGVHLELGSIRGIPLYDGDEEAANGVPASVTALKEQIARCDGLLIATPEYNHSLPGVLKNAFDWLSRPSADIARVFHGRPVAVIGATVGPGGTILAQAAWLPVLRALGTAPWFGAKLHVSGASKAFDESGKLTDEKLRTQVASFVQAFAAATR
ncbi:MAG: NAD(P)H-dependent oxidoreductase [Planctomycetes bacterium]|nr:NAD(P)H-dependent oxidoreductase [Planctomycetota bacterium]